MVFGIVFDVKMEVQNRSQNDLKIELQNDLQNDLEKDLKMKVFLTHPWDPMIPLWPQGLVFFSVGMRIFLGE